MKRGRYSTLSLEEFKREVNKDPGLHLNKNLIEGCAELWISGDRGLSLS